jgi:6-phosphogluconolactonase (cycloisomerase 2 family)
MTKSRWAWGLLALVPFLAGCSGFWDAPNSSSSTTTTTTTLTSGYFFVLDQDTSKIISYNVAAGVLTEAGTIAVPATPIAMTVAPNNAFLYVSTLNGIYLYTISGGTLTLGNSSSLIINDPAVAMVVDSTDSWLIETSGDSPYTLNAIPIVSTTGIVNASAAVCSGSTSVVCTAKLPGTAGTSGAIVVNQMAIAPNNQFIFLADDTNGTEIYTFTAAVTSSAPNPFGATLATLIPANYGGSTLGAAHSAAVDPTSRLLYVGESVATSSGGGLRAFTFAYDSVKGFTLTEISGSPYPSGSSGPYAILPKATGDFVYVANWNGTSAGNIATFSISDTSKGVYSLTALSTSATTGIKPVALAEDSNAEFVLAECGGGSPYLDIYFFDSTTPSTLDLTLTSSAFAGITVAAAR